MERLIEERPGLAFLSEYYRPLLSGLSRLGRLRARRAACYPDPPLGLALISLVNSVVFEVIRQYLFHLVS